ncbi:MAG: hypothetical protein BMS9Abin12_2294 [Acidimicrobiia bacterium]|nr:MAG: hypothetical protein BMS9Abin12_2294 [Acidimicrobiia bacterium]
MTDATLFCYPHEFISRATEQHIRSVIERTACTGLTVASAYHTARDLLPHNPAGRLEYLEGGVTYFRPEISRYPISLQPKASALCDETDPLGEIVDAATRADVAVTAWVVYLHNTRLGTVAPETTVTNVFGDRIVSTLCPANPQVEAYVEALTADIASRGVSAIAAESLHFHPLEHGYHHERYFIDLSKLARFLMAVCFCGHCRRSSEARGIDVGGAAAGVRRVLDLEFAEAGVGALGCDLATIEARCGTAAAAYVANRYAIVDALVAGAALVARDAGIDFEVIDPSGVLDDDIDVGFLHTASDPVRLDRHLTANAVLAYGSSAEGMLDHYVREVGADRLRAVLRPMYPDCLAGDDLVRRLRDARQLGINRFGFYHYDLMRLNALDWIRSALESDESRTSN